MTFLPRSRQRRVFAPWPTVDSVTGARARCRSPVTAFRGWNDAWLDPGFRSWNIESYLPSIDVPTLVIQGEDDVYGTRAQVDAIVRGVPTHVDVEMLSPCGHAPHRDRESETLVAISSRVRAW